MPPFPGRRDLYSSCPLLSFSHLPCFFSLCLTSSFQDQSHPMHLDFYMVSLPPQSPSLVSSGSLRAKTTSYSVLAHRSSWQSLSHPVSLNKYLLKVVYVRELGWKLKEAGAVSRHIWRIETGMVVCGVNVCARTHTGYLSGFLCWGNQQKNLCLD